MSPSPNNRLRARDPLPPALIFDGQACYERAKRSGMDALAAAIRERLERAGAEVGHA